MAKLIISKFEEFKEVQVICPSAESISLPGGPIRIDEDEKREKEAEEEERERVGGPPGTVPRTRNRMRRANTKIGMSRPLSRSEPRR
ncbi:hypothetical protein PFISCL1PPCAC_4782, partial [Pristionchus fissidentatus]